MKSLLLIPLSLLLCLLLLSCGTGSTGTVPDEDVQREDTARMLQESGDLKPGGNMDFDMNSDGSFSYSYENPDGSSGGGGGIILD